MNPVLAVAGLVVFVSGFSLGLIVGIKLQHRNLIREVAVQAREIKGWLVKALDRVSDRRAVGVFMILMALLIGNSQRESGHASRNASAAAADALAAVNAVQAQNTCLTTYANQLYESLTPRQAANEKLQAADQEFKRTDQVVSTALARLLEDVLVNHVSDEVKTREALALKQAADDKAAAATHANAVADRLNRERARNPYPSPPKQVCP